MKCYISTNLSPLRGRMAKSISKRLDSYIESRYQPLSTSSTFINPINPHQPSSTPINPHQPSSTPINPHQPSSTSSTSSTLINPHQPSSTLINPHQPHQPSSTLINPHQPPYPPLFQFTQIASSAPHGPVPAFRWRLRCRRPSSQCSALSLARHF